MNDRQILTELKQKPSNERRKQLEEVLWGRYQRLVHKNWGILVRQMNNSSQILSREDDYFSDAYIAMRKCIDAINLDKIKNDNWKFVGYYRFYLRNVRSNLIRTLSREYNNECSITTQSLNQQEISLADLMVSKSEEFTERMNPADILIYNEGVQNCNRAVAYCMKGWDDIRKKIFTLREDGIPKKKIADELKVHPATVTYYMKGMKRDLEEALLLDS